MIRPKGLGGPPTDTYHCEYCGADFPYGSDHSPDDCIAHLRAQLLAARAEALEWAYDNTGLDMSFSSRHRDKAHFVRDGLAALRAKGGGK